MNSRWANAEFRKASRSFWHPDECVEVAELPDGTFGIRDSKNPAGPVLEFSRGEMEAFADGIRNGEFGI